MNKIFPLPIDINPPKIINFDKDNTLAFGAVSWSTLFKAWLGKYPEIYFLSVDAIEAIIRDGSSINNHLIFKQVLANISYSDTLRPIQPGADNTIMTLAQEFGAQSLNVLSGRDKSLLLLRTLHNLNNFGILDYIQGSVYLKPKGFSSAKWKANVMRYQAIIYPDKEIVLVDNDIVACIAIAEGLHNVGVKNFKIYIKQTLETNEVLRKLLRIKLLPRNVEVFKGFPELDKLLLEG